jgi:hypothetical protein
MPPSSGSKSKSSKKQKEASNKQNTEDGGCTFLGNVGGIFSDYIPEHSTFHSHSTESLISDNHEWVLGDKPS